MVESFAVGGVAEIFFLCIPEGGGGEREARCIVWK